MICYLIFIIFFSFFVAEPDICEQASQLEQIQTARVALDSEPIKGTGSC